MKLSTKQKLRRALYPIAGILVGVAEALQGAGDIFQLTWAELGMRALRALPFAAMGWIARQNLLQKPPVDEKETEE